MSTKTQLTHLPVKNLDKIGKISFQLTITQAILYSAVLSWLKLMTNLSWQIFLKVLSNDREAGVIDWLNVRSYILLPYCEEPWIHSRGH
jgi:hypothetical protein